MGIKPPKPTREYLKQYRKLQGILAGCKSLSVVNYDGIIRLICWHETYSVFEKADFYTKEEYGQFMYFIGAFNYSSESTKISHVESLCEIWLA
jgi:hypothetical protein